MTGSKITSMNSAEMRARRERGESRTDWDRVRREANLETDAAEENRSIGEAISRKRGRPVVGEPKAAISLRLPVSVLEHWKATGPGWQTRMIELLARGK
ncbi:BrnA antitoxin of type II toxin-antitoxin system [Paraburkholderia silvatlantica]|uniref:BrnA antitoxin of type II toxin-antitoxin system n=1 Tax=Paraburkholderia silvatlantica TaxID=321895 RepID=A0A2V4TW65_9BURK|nr:BrnA antitoxin family protein [Paraburkholderia silvatlantica]PYE22854.1 BrnA antitoxin of type II toxin-antitoxin system [Paraburkholderia silvatlantica]